jgi:uncharacterized LabA/DUF88 family protein
LLHDGHLKRYDVAVVVSNDSDLVTPIKLVKEELKIPVGIINPYKKTAHALQKEATFVRSLRKGVLNASQFPHTLNDASGQIVRPNGW